MDARIWMSTGATTLTIVNRKMFIDYLRHTLPHFLWFDIFTKIVCKLLEFIYQTNSWDKKCVK